MRRGTFLVLVGASLVLLDLPAVLNAEPSCRWVEARGEAVLADATADEARSLALRHARAQAVREVSGTELQSYGVVRDMATAVDLVRVSTRGYVLEEEVVRWEQYDYRDAPDNPPLTAYRVRLRVCVALLNSKRDPYFKVTATLNKETFVAGEKAIIDIRCTGDCHLTIFNWTADNHFTLLLPNDYQRKTYLQSSEAFVFPPPGSGLGLIMETLPGHRLDTEAFLIVATKKEFDAPARLGRREGLSMGDVFGELLDLPASEWAEDFKVYEVRVR